MSFCSDHQQEMRQSTFAGKEHTFYCPIKGCSNRYNSTTNEYFKAGPKQPRPGARTGNGPLAASSPPGSSGAALAPFLLRLEVLKLAVQSEATRMQAGEKLPAVEIASKMMLFVEPPDTRVVTAAGTLTVAGTPVTVGAPPPRPRPIAPQANEQYFNPPAEAPEEPW